MADQSRKNRIKGNTQYFEAIIQLRKPSQELVNFVADYIESKDAFISKVEEIEQGVDLYISSKGVASALGKILDRQFVGQLKTSATLHTKSKTGEDLYRVTILFSLCPFKTSERVIYREEEATIVGINSKKIRIRYDNGDKTEIEYEDFITKAEKIVQE